MAATKVAEKPEKVFRTYTLKEVRIDDADDKPPMLVGYAAVFDSVTDAMEAFGWREVIRSGAFTKTLQESDVRALVNHDPNLVLGRTKAGTLRLAQDDHGLRVEIDPPDTSVAQDLIESIRRGDIDQMSFAFQVIKQRWTDYEDEPSLREILEVRLFDVSVVTFPAYEDTAVGLRTREQLDSLVERAKAGSLDQSDLEWLFGFRSMLPGKSADEPSGDAHSSAVPLEESVTRASLDSARRQLELKQRTLD